MADIVLGIDLGTSYSTAAAYVDGRLHYAVDGRGEPCVPSTVYFPKTGAPVVGIEAERMRATDPTATIVGIKRLLGAVAGSEAARLADATSAYKLRARSDGSVAVVVRNTEHEPAEVASLILRYLRERAEAKFGARISKAILTMPVRADKAQQDATLRAAKLAGLDVLQTIHEPSAGACAYGLDRFRGHRRMLVFDFGGGTFDVTVLEQNDNVLDVLGAGGDSLLGGDNFDEAFATLVFNYLYRAHRIDAANDLILRDKVQRHCEQTKRALSSAPEARLRIRDAFSGNTRGSQDFEMMVSRTDVEASWAELVQRAIKETAETLLGTGLRPKDLEQIVLVGGTTFVPLVRQQVTHVFQRPCAQTNDPQTAVACGAALFGAREFMFRANGRL